MRPAITSRASAASRTSGRGQHRGRQKMPLHPSRERGQHHSMKCLRQRAWRPGRGFGCGGERRREARRQQLWSERTGGADRWSPCEGRDRPPARRPSVAGGRSGAARRSAAASRSSTSKQHAAAEAAPSPPPRSQHGPSTDPHRTRCLRPPFGAIWCRSVPPVASTTFPRNAWRPGRAGKDAPKEGANLFAFSPLIFRHVPRLPGSLGLGRRGG